MCIIMSSTGGHVDVGATKIFARLDRVESGPEINQYLVYQMNINAHGARSAMILPIPEATHQDNAVEFINLQGYKDFFTDCEKGFEPPQTRGIKSLDTATARGLLSVEKVGDYIASWVPTVRDLDRLDPVFRIPEILFDAFPRYSLYGFAVFQFDTANVTNLQRRHGQYGGKTTIQPMALKFRTAIPREIYFPTVHFHGDGLHDRDEFDHVFYWQGMNSPDVHTSNLSAGRFMDIKRAGGSGERLNDPGIMGDAGYRLYQLADGIVNPMQWMHRAELVGTFDNKDAWIREVTHQLVLG